MKRSLTWAAAIILLLALVSCRAPVGQRGDDLVTITINDSISARVLMPDVSLLAGEYLVHGDGTSGPALGADFDIVLTPASPSAQLSLLPGDWDFTCVVMNDDATPVAVGSAAASELVELGVGLTVNLDAVPYTGLGTYDLDISWVPDVLASPGLEAELVAFGGASTTVPTTVLTSVTGEGTVDIEQGWYSQFVRLTDSGVLSSGIVETCRIAFAATTLADYFLTVDQLSGDVTVDATWAPGLPLNLTVDVSEGLILLYAGQSSTVSVTGADNDGGTGLIYAWYIDGDAVALGTTASYTLNQVDFENGASNYLSAIVWQDDGARAGDAQWNVQATDDPTYQVTIQWDSVVDDTYAVVILDGASTLVVNDTGIVGTGAGQQHIVNLEPFGASDYRFKVSHTTTGAEEWWDGQGSTIANADPVTFPTPTVTTLDFGAISSTPDP